VIGVPGIVGVLALQGDYALHARVLRSLGAETRLVRSPEELADCDGLVVPGGESTTLRKLLRRSGLDRAIAEFADRHPVLGTCAGGILLATELEDGRGVEPLGLVDITVRRNGYGRQVDSFETELEGDETGVPVAFIRAPRITRAGAGVEVLARLDADPVAVRQGRITLLTFHPEVTGSDAWHREWLASAAKSLGAA
jgi:5'-phosphate synthase pdxT subunit